MKDSEIVKSAAILVSIAERGSDVDECERSLDELERLLDTAGGSVFARVLQVKDSFDPRTCIGSGKVKEISELCRDNAIELVIFDFELTPAQIRNLENGRISTYNFNGEIYKQYEFATIKNNYNQTNIIEAKINKNNNIDFSVDLNEIKKI